MIGGHHHHNRRAKLLCLPCPRHHDIGGEMADCHDDRHSAIDMGKAKLCQMLALVIGNQELLGKIGKDADAIAPLVDHAVQNPAHAVIVDGTIFGKGCRRDRPDTAVGTGGHGDCASSGG